MKYFTICFVSLLVAFTIIVVTTPAAGQGYFAEVPTDKIHTMRVWEDGSFEIEYKDYTSEVGCLPEGICND